MRADRPGCVRDVSFACGSPRLHKGRHVFKSRIFLWNLIREIQKGERRCALAFFTVKTASVSFRFDFAVRRNFPKAERPFFSMRALQKPVKAAFPYRPASILVFLALLIRFGRRLRIYHTKDLLEVVHNRSNAIRHDPARPFPFIHILFFPRHKQLCFSV